MQDFDDDEAQPKFNWGYIPTAYLLARGHVRHQPERRAAGCASSRRSSTRCTRAASGSSWTWSTTTRRGCVVRSRRAGVLLPAPPDGTLANGSGCGNEFRSEAPMARRLILDSLKFWTREYGIDGYRFDLMALIDQETMRQAERELRAINPGIVLFGEPWTAGPVAVAEQDRQDARFTRCRQGRSTMISATRSKARRTDATRALSRTVRTARRSKTRMRVSDWFASPGAVDQLHDLPRQPRAVGQAQVSMPNADDRSSSKR